MNPDIDSLLEFIDKEFSRELKPDEADLIVIDISDFKGNYDDPILSYFRDIPPEWFRRRYAIIPIILVNLSDSKDPKSPDLSDLNVILGLGVNPPVLSTEEMIGQLKWLSYFCKKARTYESFLSKSLNDRISLGLYQEKSHDAQTKEK
jgi:hypothetical protein